MTDNMMPGQGQLWRAGFDLFSRHFKAWLPWAVGFFVVIAIFNIAAYDPTLQPFLEKIAAARKAGQKMTPEESAETLRVVGHAAVVHIPALLAMLALAYTYVAFFMQRQFPLVGAPRFGVGRVFFWLWNCLLLALLGILCGGFLMGVPAGVGVALAKTHWIFALAGILLALAGFLFTVFVFLRLALVPSLAICGVPKAFTASWQVMKGNCWRFIISGVGFLIVIGFFWLLALLAEKIFIEILYDTAPGLFPGVPVSDTPPAHPVLARLVTPAPKLPYGPSGNILDMIFYAANLCFFGGFLRAFYAAATYILCREKQADDPAFKLVASS